VWMLGKMDVVCVYRDWVLLLVDLCHLYMKSNLCSNNKVGGSDGKEPACNTGGPGSIPGSGRSSGEGNGNLLQYSYLENSMERGAWQAKVHGVAKSQTRLSDQHFHFHF